MDTKLASMSCKELSSELEGNTSSRLLLLIDVRSSTQYNSKHIQNSENINFSSILLRRLLKGVVKLDSLVSTQVEEQMRAVQKIVVYDSCSSSESCLRSELLRHTQIFAKSEECGNAMIYFLDGGFDAFSEQFPHLCAAAAAASNGKFRKTHSSLGISVNSASLPVLTTLSTGTNTTTTTASRRQKLQLLHQTTSVDCSRNSSSSSSSNGSSQFGPPVELLPHLILGCAKDSSNLTALRKHGVTAVLNVSHNCPNHFEGVLEYKSIPVQDSYQADLLSKMDTAIAFIDSVRDRKGCVFVHCHAGISRSATVCISYIMKTMQWSLSRAYDFVKQKRPCISPNLHFMGQLLEFEKQLSKSQESKMLDTTTTTSSGTTLGFVSMNTTCTSNLSSSSVDELMEEDEDCVHDASISSASAPTSLNFDSSSSNSSDDSATISHRQDTSSTSSSPAASLQRVCEEAVVSMMTKPTRLFLTQQQQKQSKSDSAVCCKSARKKMQLPLNGNSSISLPTTPINYFNCLASLVSSPSRSSLPHSPCRVVAQLGSRSESNLNTYAQLTESM